MGLVLNYGYADPITSHFCGYFGDSPVTNAPKIKCWGLNYDGYLGTIAGQHNSVLLDKERSTTMYPSNNYDGDDLNSVGVNLLFKDDGSWNDANYDNIKYYPRRLNRSRSFKADGTYVDKWKSRHPTANLIGDNKAFSPYRKNVSYTTVNDIPIINGHVSKGGVSKSPIYISCDAMNIAFQNSGEGESELSFAGSCSNDSTILNETDCTGTWNAYDSSTGANAGNCNRYYDIDTLLGDVINPSIESEDVSIHYSLDAMRLFISSAKVVTITEHSSKKGNLLTSPLNFVEDQVIELDANNRKRWSNWGAGMVLNITDFSGCEIVGTNSVASDYFPPSNECTNLDSNNVRDSDSYVSKCFSGDAAHSNFAGCLNASSFCAQGGSPTGSSSKADCIAQPAECSDNTIGNEVDCVAAGETWQLSTWYEYRWFEALLHEQPLGCVDISTVADTKSECDSLGDSYGRCMLYGVDKTTTSSDTRSECEGLGGNYYWVSDYWGWQSRYDGIGNYTDQSVKGYCHRSYLNGEELDKTKCDANAGSNLSWVGEISTTCYSDSSLYACYEFLPFFGKEFY